MLRLVKRGSLALSKRAGVTQWVGRSGWRRARLLILCYHGISLHDEHHWAPSLFMSPRMFAQRLRVLQRHGCTVLPLTEAIERLSRHDLPDRAVVLTFDDGYYNFLIAAYPALRAFGFPATVYVPTLRCEHNYPVANLLISYALWTHQSTVFEARGVPGLTDGEYSLATNAERDSILERMRGEGERSQHTNVDHDATARVVLAQLGIDYEWFVRNRRFSLMNPSEVTALSAAGIDFQLHTHTHRTPDDPEQFTSELRTNRERLEAFTGQRSQHFCYPSGVYRQSYLPLLRAEGIVTATTCEPGMVTAESNPLLLNRFVDTQSVSGTEFEAWISGTAACLSSLRPGYGAAL